MADLLWDAGGELWDCVRIIMQCFKEDYGSKTYSGILGEGSKEGKEASS